MNVISVRKERTTEAQEARKVMKGLRRDRRVRISSGV